MSNDEHMEPIEVIGYRDDYRLSPHFTYGEFTISQTAIRNNIDNTPTEEYVRNMESLCKNVLEPIRSHFGIVTVSSGFRCEELNKSIGGSSRSQHRFGEAADIHSGASVTEIFEWVVLDSGIVWDQIIHEFSRWIHISHTRNKTNRKKITTARKVDGKTVYTHYTRNDILHGEYKI